VYCDFEEDVKRTDPAMEPVVLESVTLVGVTAVGPVLLIGFATVLDTIVGVEVVMFPADSILDDVAIAVPVVLLSVLLLVNEEM